MTQFKHSDIRIRTTAYNPQCVLKENKKERKKDVRRLTSLTASWAASLVQKVTKAYPLFRPVNGSIIKRRSHIGPAFSNNGTSSSSNKSLGILPTNICKRQSIFIHWVYLFFFFNIYKQYKQIHKHLLICTNNTQTSPPPYLCTNGRLLSWIYRLWRRSTILSLSSSHIKSVAGSLQECLQVRILKC